MGVYDLKKETWAYTRTYKGKMFRYSIRNYRVFKRLGSRGLHNLFNQYIFHFHKRYEYCKTGACDFCVNFPRYFEPLSLDGFREYKISLGLYNGKNRRSFLRLQ